ncbi:MAG: sortase family protein [candidate division CPR2 bacterium GW2011_GWC1_39_9]|uniref:Sortase family protein n=1 Tax=candidate division CPR2 bacterium GW2011_GWC2_39_10 TaxID=1618345 RepID=A0A0G0P9G0_UNCC2|nr:MAG: sortase family protein [candidate division CPR2 bacterium GW2011_GWC2_39_10]KKR34628.1 MAG: sortase family protein [candidate division CPR2 bacterium GW2011_GWC1_39_9]
MIRRNIEPEKDNNSSASFENYIPDKYSSPLENHKEEIVSDSNNHDVQKDDPINIEPSDSEKPNKNEDFNFHFPKVEFKKPKKEFLKKLKKTNSKRIAKYFFSIIVLFLGLYFTMNAPMYYYRLTHLNPRNLVSKEVSKAKPTPAPKSQTKAPTTESKLIVNKIKVDAPIVFVNSRAEKDIQEGLRSGVVHYAGTAKPGEIGNVFVTGHSSNYWWEKGEYNYVFSILDRLEIGDKATIYYDGLVWEYTVYEKKIVDPTDVAVLNQTSTPTLTLMTCTPPGTSWKRLIVRFNQSYPKEITIPKNTPIKEPTKKPEDLPAEQDSFFTKLRRYLIPN